MTQESLRAAIGMVPQDTVLFNDTIAYNIRYGRPSASEDEVRAGRRAGADRHASSSACPRATNRGRRARPEAFGRREAARGHRPHHPEGAADPDPRRGDVGARHPYRAGDPGGARPGRRGRTTLVIAHRLSTVVNADEIIVLDEGRIVERGTHAGAARARGLYASMWNRQREATEAEERLRVGARGRRGWRHHSPPHAGGTRRMGLRLPTISPPGLATSWGEESHLHGRLFQLGLSSPPRSGGEVASPEGETVRGLLARGSRGERAECQAPRMPASMRRFISAMLSGRPSNTLRRSGSGRC